MGFSVRGRLALVAVAVLAVTAPVSLYVAERIGGPDPAVSAGASMGTASLGTATCAKWRTATVPSRMATIQALGIAATQPDPENAGATLSEGDAYGLFQRICSPGAPSSTLLYEAYNRAASFRSIRP